MAFLFAEQHPLWFPLTGRGLFYAAFVIYSLIALSTRRLEDGAYALLRLVLDVIFFLICASGPPDHGGWLTTLLFLFLMVTATLFHDWREVTIIFGLTLLFLWVTAPDEVPFLWLAIVTLGLLSLIFSLHKRLLKERLAMASRQAVMYRTEAEKARESERQRIAADFHDGPLQSFISFQMRLEIIRKMIDRNRTNMALDELDQLQQLNRTQIADLRSFVRSMRMSDVDGGSLVSAVRQVVEDFQKTSGISVSLIAGDSVGAAEPEISHEILQIVREALHNIQKHAKASRVALSLERHGDVVELSVDDDGSGFPFAGAFSLDELEQLRIGPGSIKRRVRALNGELRVESKAGRGASLRVRVAL